MLSARIFNRHSVAVKLEIRAVQDFYILYFFVFFVKTLFFVRDREQGLSQNEGQSSQGPRGHYAFSSI